MPQLRSSDLNIARAQSSDITIVTATIDVPWVPAESCAGKQTGAKGFNGRRAVQLFVRP